jgi:glutathione S-transferase
MYPGHIQDGNLLTEPLPAISGLVLYTHVMCPYAQRVWLTVLEKCAQHTLVNIDLSNKPEWFTLLNPRGQVPYVTLEGKGMTESLEICKCAPSETPFLYPWEPAFERMILEFHPFIVDMSMQAEAKLL